MLSLYLSLCENVKDKHRLDNDLFIAHNKNVLVSVFINCNFEPVINFSY